MDKKSRRASVPNHNTPANQHQYSAHANTGLICINMKSLSKLKGRTQMRKWPQICADSWRQLS